tara:strand:+ start:2929 stop:3645 length:717 start_codon:yes stop_codon:yes gene_type:complete
MSQVNNTLLFGNGHLGQFLLKILPEISWTSRSKNGGVHFDLEQSESFELDDNFTTIIWAIPPHQKTINFFQNISKSTKIIYISSTSVFSVGSINNESEKSPMTKNAKLLDQVESYLQDNFPLSIIIRPGGLVDEKRHPRKFFTNAAQMKNSHHTPNLIHTEDVARFIHHCMDSKVKFGAFNLVAPMKKTKKEFYGRFLNDTNIQYLNDDSTGKSFDTSWMNQLNFSLKYPDLFEYFKN